MFSTSKDYIFIFIFIYTYLKKEGCLKRKVKINKEDWIGSIWFACSYNAIKGGQVQWIKKVIIWIEVIGWKVVKWSDESDNGDVLIKFICIIYFENFIPIIGTQMHYLALE